MLHPSLSRAEITEEMLGMDVTPEQRARMHAISPLDGRYAELHSLSR